MVVKNAAYPVQWMGMMMICCGMLGVSVKMETVTLIGKIG